jgi:hypothetical protein
MPAPENTSEYVVQQTKQCGWNHLGPIGSSSAAMLRQPEAPVKFAAKRTVARLQGALRLAGCPAAA